jgi:hypothetical protein
MVKSRKLILNLLCCAIHVGQAWIIPHQIGLSGFLRSRTKASCCPFYIFLRTKPYHSCQARSSRSAAEPAGPKRVGIIGSGAVGLYYGARLIESGNDVSFLCRRDADALKANGLSISSHDGDMYFPPNSLQIYTKSEDMGVMDWVILALKSYSLPAATALAR